MKLNPVILQVDTAVGKIQPSKNIRQYQPSKQTETVSLDVGAKNHNQAGSVQFLDVDPSVRKCVINLDLNENPKGSWCRASSQSYLQGTHSANENSPLLRPDSPDFVDDLDVPSLL